MAFMVFYMYIPILEYWNIKPYKCGHDDDCDGEIRAVIANAVETVLKEG